MRAIDVTAGLLCLAVAVLIYMRQELGRRRHDTYLDMPRSVRLVLILLCVLFVGRAWRIYAGYGEADLSEVAVYAGVLFALVLQIGGQVIGAHRTVTVAAKAQGVKDVLPAIEETVAKAVHEATPAYLRDLATAPDPIAAESAALLSELGRARK